MQDAITIEWVHNRIVEAAETLRVLPRPDGPKLAQSDWRGFYRDWGDAVQGEEGRFIRDSRGRIVHGRDQFRTPLTNWHESFTRPAPPEHGAIDRAYESTLWLRFLRDDRRLVLALWLTLGENLGITDAARVISRRLKMKPPCRATVRRWRDTALKLIVEGLERERLPANQRLRATLRSSAARFPGGSRVSSPRV